jgi:hypothetical protein
MMKSNTNRITSNMTKTAARMIIVLGCIVKPVVPAGGLPDVPGPTDGTWRGFPVVDVYCLCFMEGEGTTFMPGGVLVDG